MGDELYAGSDLRSYQGFLVDLTREIVHAFESNGVRYFAVFGTCLGAMRHKGIIPWDDDVDLAVLREDYDRAMEVVRTCCPSIYAWDIFSDSSCPLNYGRCFFKIGVDEPIDRYRAYVDIFVLDNIPRSNAVRAWQRFWATCIHHRIARLSGRPVYFKTIGFWRKMLPLFELLFYFVSVAKLKRLFVRCLSARSSELVGSAFQTTPDASSPRRFFDDYRKVEFEGIEVRVPHETVDYLAYTYGDWQTPPPEGSRRGHAFVNGIWDVEHPADELRRMVE